MRFTLVAGCVMLTAAVAAAPPEQSGKTGASVPADRRGDVSPAPELFAQGQKALRSGELEKAQGFFDRVAVLNSPEWSCPAELLAIRIAGQRGDLATATSRLELFRRRPEALAYRYRSDALALWLAAKAGNSEIFLRQWQTFQSAYLPFPDAEVAAALALTVDQLLAAHRDVDAVKLLAQSSAYQTSDAARLAMLRREFDLCREPAALAAVADRYARWFPDTEETAKIQLQTAVKLMHADQPEFAQKLLELVAGNKEYPAALRKLALETAAVAAEKAGNDAIARTMYQSLIAMSNAGFDERLKFGAYLLRTNDDPGAEKIFRELWLDQNARREVAGANLLRVLIKMKKTEDALIVAAKLRDSAEYGRYAAIKLAELQEDKGNLAAARDAYLYLARRYPADLLIAHVDYRIAFLGRQLALPGAVDELVGFAEKYPADPKAPRALLLAMQTSGNADAARPFFERFSKRYVSDALFPSAVQQQFYFEMAARHYDRAILLSETYPRALGEPEFGAAAGLARLHVLFDAGQWNAALTLGKTLMERYPAAASAAETAFVCGNVESTLCRYPEALVCYERAFQLRPAGKLGECAHGRIADMCYVLFANTQQAEYLERAETIYRDLAEKSLVPAMRLEAFCRLGRTLELSGRYKESLVAYDKALFCALEMKSEKLPVEAIWCYRAAYGAIRIRMHSSRRMEREAALRTVDALESLQLGDYYEDFPALRRDINRKKAKNIKR